MATIGEKLQYTLSAKNSISAVMVSAGIDVPTPFGEYAQAMLSTLSEGEECRDAYRKSMAGMIQAQNLTGSVTPENMRLYQVPKFIADEITIIRGSAFNGCRYLSVAEFPNALTAWGSSFLGCVGLLSAYLPNCVDVQNDAFKGCSAMTDCNVSSATFIRSGAFANCTSLSSVNLDSCTNLAAAFGTDSTATAITLPNLTELHLPSSPRIDTKVFGSSATAQRTAIMDLYLPNRTKAQVLNFSNYSTWYLDPNCTIHASDESFLYGS